jgi:hypothetical protein
VRVKWAERRYLVDATEMEDLCKRLSEGLMWHSAYLHSEDEALPVFGWPSVPPQYEGLLPEKQTCAKIVEVQYTIPSGLESEDDWPGYMSVRAFVDAGETPGFVGGAATVGMFYDFPIAMVSSCDEGRCAVDYEFAMDAGERPPLPKIGWEFCIVDSPE